jgi:O-antigen/teichoic acid export membrane protein
MIVSVAQSAFSQYWGSQVYAIAADNEGLSRFRRIHTYVIIGLSFLAVVIAASASIVVHVVMPPSYAGAIAYIPWIALIYVVRADADYVRSALYVEGVPGHDALISIAAAVVCIAGYATLIPGWGAWGAIVATASAFVTMAVLARIFVRRRRSYSFNLRTSAGAFTIALLCCGLCAKEAPSHAGTYVAGAAVVIVYPLLLSALGCIGRDERLALYAAVSRLFQPIRGNLYEVRR